LAVLPQVVQVACKAAYLNCGQNCAGGERFFVHEKVRWGSVVLDINNVCDCLAYVGKV
jgi:acyl-CoA reductase-like NAD-dependent aldehyde dehydrogenase